MKLQNEKNKNVNIGVKFKVEVIQKQELNMTFLSVTGSGLLLYMRVAK